MANKIDPKLDRNGDPIKWDPTQITSTKPFLKIVTTAHEPITTFNNMNFVKTRSHIYTAFHKEARYINFEIGYQKEAKWFEHLNEKWANFANFFVSGFFEGIYTSTENDVTYVQIDAKIIDYDQRYRHPNSSNNNLATSPTSPTSPSTSIFAQRRTKFSSESSSHTFNSKNKPTSPKSKSVVSRNLNDDNFEDEDSNDDLAGSINPNPETSLTHKTKRKLSDLCSDSLLDEKRECEQIELSDNDNPPANKSKKRNTRGKGRGARK